jgi:hypothetical protein
MSCMPLAQVLRLCLPEVGVCLHDDGSRPGLYDLRLCRPEGHSVRIIGADRGPRGRRPRQMLQW